MPCRVGGSCFLARLQSDLFVVTAGHCLHGYSADHLRIEAIETSNLFLPFQRLHRASAPYTEDSAFIDLAILEMAPDQLSPTELHTIPTVDITSLRRRSQPMIKGKTVLATRGVLWALRGIDSETRLTWKPGFQADDL